MTSCITDSNAALSSTPPGHLIDFEVVLHIMHYLPSTHKAVVAKLVCKDAYNEFQVFKTIPASCDDLPPEIPEPTLLQYLQRYHYHPDRQQQLMAAIAKQGDLLRLQFLRQHGCAWGGTVYVEAAARGHLNVLQWLRGQDPPCDWDVSIQHANSNCYWLVHQACARAARNGHLEVLQWLRAQDSPCGWDVHVCIEAAWQGHLHVLQWALAQDPPAPWDSRACWVAAVSGHLDILQWVAAQQPLLPWDTAECLKIAQAQDRTAVVDWIMSLADVSSPVNDHRQISAHSKQFQFCECCSQRASSWFY